jgi:uncharacterized protein (TIGR03085 family)
VAASSLSFVRRERSALADLMTELGPDAPTCCAGWTTAHLAAHVVVRDTRPDAMVGYGVEGAGLGGPLVAWTHRTEDRLRTSTPYAQVVGRVRTGPPAWYPTAWPAVERAINVTEFAVHHEDVRRAQPDWTVRALSREDQDAIWSASALYARRGAGRRGVVLRRTDAPGVERRSGAAGRIVEGEPLELLLWCSGRRDVTRVTVTG